MKKLFLTCCIVVIGNVSFSQCLSPTNTNVTNISMYAATANWAVVSNANHYRIRYKEIGVVNWSYFNNVHFSQTSRNLSNLQPSTLYIWQIKTFCDSLGTIASLWSPLDTFTTLSPQCPTPLGLFVTNITHNEAVANWTAVAGADHYRIRKRELGTSNWGNLVNIDSNSTTRLLPLLQPLTTYEWKIEAYCDSTNQSNSIWSALDTFTTTAFIPAQFNPQLFFGMSSTLCNMAVTFSLRVIQLPNEPDVGTSEITADRGSFNISSVSAGDTVGTAEISTSTDTIKTTLTIGIITSSNSAIIYSIDTSGIIGFFTIQNLSGGGVKINSTSPPDGNNYTSGYNSLLIFDGLFITPALPGPLSFIANIDSELNDQFYLVDSSTIIFCNTELEEVPSERRLLKIVTILGEKSMIKQNELLFYIYDDGTVERRIIIE